LKPERITEAWINRRGIPGERHRVLRPILDVRAYGANKTALRKLNGVLTVLVADNRAIPALRTFDPHLRDVVEDALTSIYESLHILGEQFLFVSTRKVISW